MFCEYIYGGNTMEPKEKFVLMERYCYHCDSRLSYSDNLCPNCGRDNFGKTHEEPTRTVYPDVR